MNVSRIDRPLILDRVAMARLTKKHRQRVEVLAHRAEKVRARSKSSLGKRRRWYRHEFAALHWALERLGMLVLDGAPAGAPPFFASELQKPEEERERA